MNKYRYFTEAEIVGLDKELCAKLDTARHIAGVPFKITSGKRTAEQNNVLKGAASNSSHLSGKAVDLSCNNNGDLFLMLKGLLAAGFERIGIYHDFKMLPRHIHADISTDLPPKVVWLKMEQN